MSFFTSVIWIIICFFVSYFTTKQAIRYLGNKLALLDTPNARSSHTVPTPLGGGLAVIFSFVLGCVPLVFATPGVIPAVLYFSIAISLLMIVSFCDDIKHVNIVVRLVTHFFAAILAAHAVSNYGMIFRGLISKELEFVFIILAIVTAMNLFNFMDGIDGLTGSQTIFLSFGMSLIFYFTNIETNYIYIMMILASSTAGFLWFNWHPAKIFIGDTGSITLGYILAVLLLIMAAKGYLLQAIILPLYYLADAGFVLIRRIVRGEKFWLAHKQHFFQKAIIKGCSHAEVVIKIQIINMFLLAMALLTLRYNNSLETICIALIGGITVVTIGIFLLPVRVSLLDIRRAP